jgi:glycosyltransferase involved in cell wall biosynthesis
MLSRIRSRYSAYRYALAGADFHSEGGAWRSIYSFYKHLDQSGERAILIDLRSRGGMRQWVCSLLFSPRIVVNGMAAIGRWDVLLGLCVRRDAAIYLHDTEYMLSIMKESKPQAYRLLTRLLKTRRILCVSEQMAELYRDRFSARRALVVYEVTDTDPCPILDPGKINIIMVGTLDRRKGYPLFVSAAEAATAMGLPWQFHWIGGLGESDLMPVSRAIRWWGWRPSALPLVTQADCFFLSSVDDPQPLACLEALALGKRVVAYEKTGSSELITDLPGCRVYREHCPKSVITALTEALEEKVRPELMRERIIKFAGAAAFAERLKSAWEEKHF